MKRQRKFIFNFIVLLLLALNFQTVWAYETVILDYPEYQGWHRVNYLPGKKGSIAQYAPLGQDAVNYRETVVYHSYKIPNQDFRNAASLLKKQLTRAKNKSVGFKSTILKNAKNNAVAVWCADDVDSQGAQCEIVRSTVSHEGVILIHYVSRDINDFNKKKNFWLDKVSKAKTYYNYYRTDYVLNKKTYFEL